MENSTVPSSNSSKLLNQNVWERLALGAISWRELRQLSGTYFYVKKSDAYFFWKGYAVASRLILNKRGMKKCAN